MEISGKFFGIREKISLWKKRLEIWTILGIPLCKCFKNFHKKVSMYQNCAWFIFHLEWLGTVFLKYWLLGNDLILQFYCLSSILVLRCDSARTFKFQKYFEIAIILELKPFRANFVSVQKILIGEFRKWSWFWNHRRACAPTLEF